VIGNTDHDVVLATALQALVALHVSGSWWVELDAGYALDGYEAIAGMHGFSVTTFVGVQLEL
jgi:TPP-dependent 2-oxoacid decarboxylase